MTHPTAASIAQAFWKALADEMAPYDAPDFSRFLSKVKRLAEQFDAESAAGPARYSGDAEKNETSPKVGDDFLYRIDTYGLQGGLSDSDFRNNVEPILEDIRGWLFGVGYVPAVWPNSEKLTTSPGHVQIPAESNYDRCPKCTAHFPPGKTCGGEFCGLKRCSHPGCCTPEHPGACEYAECPRK